MAKIIHLRRYPRDVTRSCVGMGWARYPFFCVDYWIKIEKTWDMVESSLNRNQFLELSYEELVSKPQITVAGICGFLGAGFLK